MSRETLSLYGNTVCNPGYAEALNATFEVLPEQEYLLARERALGHLMAGALTDSNVIVGPEEVRRRYTLESLRPGSKFYKTPLDQFLQTQRGEIYPTDLNKSDLDMGDTGPVLVNSRIKTLDQEIDHPYEFFTTGLETIRENNRGPGSIGPENYATLLKFFADKADVLHGIGASPEDMRSATDRWTEGYLHISSKDKPNFIELTNIYIASSKMPKGQFPEKFYNKLLIQTLEGMPEFHRDVYKAFLRAVPKFPNSSAYADALASTTEMSILALGTIQNSLEFTSAIRAISNLSQSQSSDRSIRLVLDNGFGLEKVGTVTDCYTIVKLTYDLITRVTDDPSNTMRLKNIAENALLRSARIFKELNTADVDEGRLEDMKRKIDNARSIYDQM